MLLTDGRANVARDGSAGRARRPRPTRWPPRGGCAAAALSDAAGRHLAAPAAAGAADSPARCGRPTCRCRTPARRRCRRSSAPARAADDPRGRAVADAPAAAR
ncbi:MAG: hypothetical protein MZW92_18495 [Comamonadaceae bacterium]|nr:hypothetical protein [Comamonadaceae bacterium]